MEREWYRLAASEAAQTLAVDLTRGLDTTEAQKRLMENGPNELQDRGIKSPWLILWEQMTGLMVVILIVAALVSAFLGEISDAVAILAIVFVNAALGVRQEYRAEKAMAALKKLATPVVRVRRDGAIHAIASNTLAPGDVVLLEQGSHVPADGRLVEAANLHVDESALTGESVAVEKLADQVYPDTVPLADRKNMVYMGTSVSYGRAVYVVTATGMKTELGKIAEMIQGIDRSPTPLQVRLDHLGKVLAVVALILVGLIFALGLWREGTGHLHELFLTAVSMAVAAVPEGLPAVVTIALALGAQRMLARKALIRKLLAVEALGSVTVICSDKTGTLTENRMTAVRGRAAGAAFELPPPAPAALTPDIAMVLAAGALCNDAQLSGAEGAWVAHGDPTETALCIGAAQAGLFKADLERALPRVAEVPFDAGRRRMATLHAVADAAALKQIGIDGDGIAAIAFSKGGCGSLLGICDRIAERDAIVPLDQARRDATERENAALAGKGMRVLAIAYAALGAMPEHNAESIERGLIFAGLVAMHDPLRPEAKNAVAMCKSAGVHAIMITGDHPLTAQHIGEELGLSARGGRVVTGAEIEKMSRDELRQTLRTASVFARVAPESKLDIIAALQADGEVVAMTGDGVNDAPALKKANVGISMGITGTDVAKEASDLVLLDDNFATIVAAVSEGRTIYDNVKKFIKYLMATNSGELWLMITAPFLGMPLPLLPLQILWMNLVTDGLPALALSVEPPERDVMRRPPGRPERSLFADGLGFHIVWVGLLMCVICLATGWFYWRGEAAQEGPTRWQTMVFTILTLSQMAHVLAIRSGRESLFSAGLFSNTPLLLAVSITTAAQCMLVYVPFFQNIFSMVPLSALDMALAFALSSIVFWAVELEKLVLNALDKKKASAH